MDEPAVSTFVEGSRETVTAQQWPPKPVEHRPLYLRPSRTLAREPEQLGPEHAAPDGFNQAPLTVTDEVETLRWSTAPFDEPVEMIGTGAAHLFVDVLRLYPFAATFLPGHELVTELSCDEPVADAHNALLPSDAFHLPVGRPVTHKIYRDAQHPSRLALPRTA